MKRGLWLNLVLAVTIGVSLVGCDADPITGKSRRSNTASQAGSLLKGNDSFLDQTDGSPQVQSGRSILKDAVAVLQADLDFQIGSSLADDPTFGATTRTTQTVNDGSSGNTPSGSVNDDGAATRALQKQLQEILKAAQPLIDKVNKGQATEADRLKLAEYKKKYDEIRKKLEASKPAPPQGSNSGGERPQQKPPEPPKAEQGKKPEPPKEHTKPENHLQRPELSGGISLTKAESGSTDLSALKKKLEELQAANERLRKEQEKLRHQTEHLKAKLEELARKKEEHEKKKKEEFKQNASKDVIDNGDGTLTYVLKMSTTSKGAKVTHEVQKTVDALEKTLISETSFLEKILPNGAQMTIGRTFKLNEDGSTSATFDSEIARDGKTKKASWNKTTNPDGSSSAQGTITRPDGSVVRISIEKDAEGNVRTVAEDTKAKVKAEVDKGELDTSASAKIVDTTENKLLAEIQIEDTESVEPDAE